MHKVTVILMKSEHLINMIMAEPKSFHESNPQIELELRKSQIS